MTYAMSESNKDRVYQWILNELSQSYTYREFHSGLNADMLELDDLNKTFVCTVCLSVPRHPLLAKCKHVFCSSCLVHLFATNLHQQNDSWVVNCPQCKETITHTDLHRLGVDSSATAIETFYASTIFKCSNQGCKIKQHYNTFDVHEWLWCRNRIIKCPGRNCCQTASADE